jgi:hypothetical protein
MKIPLQPQVHDDCPHRHIIYDHPAAWIGPFCNFVQEIARFLPWYFSYTTAIITGRGADGIAMNIGFLQPFFLINHWLNVLIAVYFCDLLGWVLRMLLSVLFTGFIPH